MLLQEAHSHLAFIIAVCAALAVFAVMYLLLCMESLFRRCLTWFGAMIWICFLTVGYVSLFEKGGDYQLWEQVCVLCVLTQSCGCIWMNVFVCFSLSGCYKYIITPLRFGLTFQHWLY